MKIVVINPILYTCETNVIKKVKSIKDCMVYNLCLEMKRQGHEPVLIAAKDYEPIEKDDYDFEVIFLETIMPKIFKTNCFPFLKNLRKTLDNIRFDFIISSEVFSMNSWIVSRYFKNQTIIWHELAKHNNMMRKIPSKIWYNFIARVFFHNTKIVARSKNAQDFIKKYCNHVSDEIIDHGVDLEEFVPVREKEKQFVVVSQLIERKHIDGIIKAFSGFVKQNENFKLVIIGSGEKEVDLKKLTAELGMETNIEWKGQMSHKEMIPILSRSYALVINTEKDNSMLSIVESIATGTPIITTPIPYNCDYIAQYQLGIITASLSKNDFAIMVKENGEYVENCFAYRDKVSNEYHIKQFVCEFERMNLKGV